MNGKGIGKMSQSYIEKLQKHIKLIEEEQLLIDEGARQIAKTIEQDGLIYIFGCGHSHMFGEEFFYRAGGLGNVRPILYEPLMLHEGAAQSSNNEKKNNYIDNFIEEYPITDKDTLIVISTSGRNPVPIDIAKYGKKRGAQVITISSFDYLNYESSRHKDGIFLKHAGLININNHVPYGDSLCQTHEVSHSPVSTIIGMTIMHQMISAAIDQAEVETLPVFISGNISGSSDHNKQILEQYGERVPMLVANLEESNA